MNTEIFTNKANPIALVGFSSTGRKMSNAAYKELTDKGYQVFPINPKVTEVAGVKCYPNLDNVKDKVKTAVVFVKSPVALEVVKQAHAAGITNVWLQQGIKSPEALKFGQDNGMNILSGECFMMYAVGSDFPHQIHRWLWKVFGKFPKK
jgi:uncharacterized protein